MKTIVVQRRASRMDGDGQAIFEVSDTEVVDHIEENPENGWAYLFTYSVLVEN